MYIKSPPVLYSVSDGHVVAPKIEAARKHAQATEQFFSHEFPAQSPTGWFDDLA